MNFIPLANILLAACFALSPFAASAADPIEDFEEDIELLPNKKLEKRGERISGPITSISAAGLLFASFDKNSDYIIDALELSKGQSAAFKIADKDKSGAITLFELEDWRKAALGSLDAPPGNISFDKDYDQRVTKAEFKHALSYVFHTKDKNEDGRLSFEEITRVFEMPRRPIIQEPVENRLDRLEDPIQRRQGPYRR